jgi:hypothetical protein
MPRGSCRIRVDRTECFRYLLTSIATNGATTFLIIMTMTFGLILPRLLFERLLPTPS